MEKYIPLLLRSGLFAGLSGEEVKSMCSCLGVRKRSFEKGEYVLRSGEKAGELMILAEGRLLIQSEDYWGKRSILSAIAPGEMFGEAYAAREEVEALNDVLAVERSVVLFFSLRRMLTTCPTACAFHSRTVRNLFFAVCGKNRALVGKMGIFAGRSIREKLMAYLSMEAKRQGGGRIVLPFDRQQLADFLAVDRSAMSRELGKMRDEGLVSFSRRNFTLHEKA